MTTCGKVLGVTRWTVAEYFRVRGLRFIVTGRKHKKVPVWELKRWMEANLIQGGDALKRVLDGRRKRPEAGRGKMT